MKVICIKNHKEGKPHFKHHKKLKVGKCYLMDNKYLDGGCLIKDLENYTTIGIFPVEFFTEYDSYKKTIEREIKINILEGRYKAISAYKIPNNIESWLNCPNCGLKPLTWEFNNGSSTACGCGDNEYKHFSIRTESIMSHVRRNNGSALGYDSDKLRKNWNHWVETGEELETHSELNELGKW